MAAETIKIWFKTFIPRDCPGAEPVLGGPHKGKTMLATPGPINACFLTDQRGFRDDIDAPARMHTEIEVDVRTKHVVNQLHKCYETIQVDCKTGEETCCQTADSSHMKWSDLTVTEEGAITINLSGSSHNPCVKIVGVDVSPNLDYTGTLTIKPSADNVLVAFEGNIETYPAFEMYASVNDGVPQTIFREDVILDATPISLVGPPRRSISYQIKIPV